MKKMISILSIIMLTTLLSGCIFAWHESGTLSYKIKSKLQNKFVREKYTDNIKSKQGNLIKVKYTVNLNPSPERPMIYYDISVIYVNDNAYVNNTIFYRITDIPINQGAENDIYIPIIKNYKLSQAFIESDRIDASGRFLIGHANGSGANLKRAVRGQTFTFKNKYIEADILLCFDPVLLFIITDDTARSPGVSHS
ncbi:MAG TPA: hypothetical protein DIT05_03925 [Morganella sp. (in: Bacteria)]|nr:hypothetical protein [Morganella sp. (in: enterobacteria)]